MKDFLLIEISDTENVVVCKSKIVDIEADGNKSYIRFDNGTGRFVPYKPEEIFSALWTGGYRLEVK